MLNKLSDKHIPMEMKSFSNLKATTGLDNSVMSLNRHYMSYEEASKGYQFSVPEKKTYSVQEVWVEKATEKSAFEIAQKMLV